MDYKNTTGFHATGELEIAVGLKYYNVDYRADTATFNGISVPASSLPSEYRDLRGDGVDITAGSGVLF